MILDFNLVLVASHRSPAALDERDRLIAILQENGYQLIMTEDGTRVLMEQKVVRQKVPPCPCVCNRGGFCGGCGHAGCFGRRG